MENLPCREVCSTWRTLVPKLPKMGLLYGVSNDKAGGTETEFYFSGQNHDNDDDDEQLNCLERLTKLDHSLIMPSASVSETFMVGSCNGLVCYASRSTSSSETKVYVCNPLTGEQIEAPDGNWDRDAYTEQAIGFGYSPDSKQYKVVKILSGNVYVYTLQGGSVWRKTSIQLGETCLSGSSSTVAPIVGVFAGGTLYWMNPHNIKSPIVAFGVEHETVKKLPALPYYVRNPDDVYLIAQGSLDVNGANHVELMVLGDNLCALAVSPDKHVKIWELMYRKRDLDYPCDCFLYHWVEKFSIAWKDYSWFERLSPSKGNDNFSLWYNAVLSCYESYDPKTKTLRKLDETLKKLMDDSTPSVCTTTRATPHVNS